MSTPLRRLLVWSNGLLVISLLLSAYLPYFNPGKYWITGFAGMIFPVLFPVCCLFIPVLLLLRQKRYALITAAGVLLCLHVALHTWGIHLSPKDDIIKPANSDQFTLLTYNTSSMGLVQYQTDTARRNAVYNLVKSAAADIVCMQEFYTNDKPDLTHNLDSIRLAGPYPYHYFTCDRIHWESWYYGIILFSRFPILSAKAIPCSKKKHAGSGDSFLQADVLVNTDTVRIFSVQLTSYMFKGEDYSNMQSGGSRSLLSKMRHTFHERSAQARHLASLVAASPYPVIVCGDFNDTPVSYTYRTIRPGLQDAFLETGRGWGRTLSFLSPSLRIDYLLPQDRFNIHGSKVFHIPFSEHFPFMARLSLKKH
ncbi:endonuclease/exonuclease/phosphatase family protein [Chitinophaga nivalis]|uniref:Endonuclease/exonuclease/phosphatase family protein n=1 Tax=Chitinophaga nivalis TaxID=2991709 RepID=A0ABT3IVN3_9BACT|nr:endonuclease/exonuclease/phosphatase family protein [Chitinophaga nivalis]MCW3462306.1 endonuclease/exonuclease/phosphatase family protein [Chitinophaga nivalis]MCW3488003.1 endonuclease/exonuclease/phosphatase family protein [Chitinophaga nivalis]